MEQVMGQLQTVGVQWAQQIIGALLLLVIGWRVASWLTKRVERMLLHLDVDPSLRSFMRSVTNIGLKGILFIMLLGIFGVETTSIIALLGAMGFAVGMALQGSLGNIAGGVLILLLKPFRVGDFIEGAGYSGSVKDITVFNTQLTTPDNRTVIIPNGALSNASVINYSVNDTRRVDLVFGVGYDAEIGHVKEVISRVIEGHEAVLTDPEPFIRLSGHGASSLDFTVRVWVNASDYWTVYFDLMEEVKDALDAAKIDIPYPHAVHIVKQG